MQRTHYQLPSLHFSVADELLCHHVSPQMTVTAALQGPQPNFTQDDLEAKSGHTPPAFQWRGRSLGPLPSLHPGGCLLLGQWFKEAWTVCSSIVWLAAAHGVFLNLSCFTQVPQPQNSCHVNIGG